MPLSLVQSGVKLLQKGQKATNAFLNQLGLRTVTVQGQASTSQIEDDAITAAKLKADAHAFAAVDTSSTATNHILTTGSSLTDGNIADGTVIAWRAPAAATGALNIQVDSMSSRDLMKQHDTELASGDIELGQIIEARWDATNTRWQWLTTPAQIADDAVTTDKIADDAVTTDKIADDAVTAAKLGSDGHGFAATENTSTAGNHVLTTGSSLTDGNIVDGTWIAWRAQDACSGAVNVQVDSMTTRALKKLHDQDPASGDIEAGQIIEARWDATNTRWQMTSQLAQ